MSGCTYTAKQEHELVHGSEDKWHWATHWYHRGLRLPLGVSGCLPSRDLCLNRSEERRHGSLG